MLKLNKRISGSTLIEVLVSMTILVMVILFSFSMIASVTRSHVIELRTQALFALDLAMSTPGESDQEPDIIDYGSFYLEFSIEDYGFTGTIKLLQIKAKTPEGRIIIESKKLVGHNNYKINHE